MDIGIFLKSRAGEFVLCGLASTALCFTLCSGFFAAQPLQAQPWVIAAACFAFTALLFVVSATPRTLLVGGISLAVGVVAVFAACLFASPGATPVDDVEGNYCIFTIIVVATSLLVFLLSRAKVGTVVLLVAGMLVCGFVEYLYWHGHVVAFALFAVAAVGLVMFKTYEASLVESESESLAFASVSVVGVVIAVAAVAVGIGVFAVAIAPMEPQGHIVKLFTEYRRPEVIEITGTGDAEQVQGDDTSSNSVEGDANTGDSDEVEQRQATAFESLFGLGTDLTGADGATTGLRQADMLFLLFPLLIVLLVAGSILAKRAQRRRRFKRMVAGGNDAAVENLYRFFLDRFRRMKIERPVGLSLAEFSEGFADSFAQFERAGGAVGADAVANVTGSTGFAALTEAYSRVVYGASPATDEDRALFENYYNRFYKNMCRSMGRFKYALRFFTL